MAWLRWSEGFQTPGIMQTTQSCVIQEDKGIETVDYTNVCSMYCSDLDNPGVCLISSDLGS